MYHFNMRGRDIILRWSNIMVGVQMLELVIDEGASRVNPHFLPILDLEVIQFVLGVKN